MQQIPPFQGLQISFSVSGLRSFQQLLDIDITDRA